MWQRFHFWHHQHILSICSHLLWPSGQNSLLWKTEHQILHNVKCLLLSQVYKGIRKTELVQIPHLFNKVVYREQAFMKSLIFKFLAWFTPKQILNCSSRKTFHKWYSSLNLPKHTQTHPHIFILLSALLLSSTNGTFKSIYFSIQVASNKDRKATCWENNRVDAQTPENSLVSPRAITCFKKKEKTMWCEPCLFMSRP